jgi:acyl carrier protein
MRRDTVMAKLSRAEITAKTIEIIHNCVPELQGVELTEASVVNTDMSMDSMSFIMVICKLEAEFNVKIPNRQWNRLKTLGQVVDAIEKYQKD